MLDPRSVCRLGIGDSAALLSRIGLWKADHKRRGGMSYDQVLAATLAYRSRQKTLADLRKKKRRTRRAREREHLLLLGAPWPQ
ncbi:MAG: hypothetical protein MUE49_13685 [Rhodospirillales bacterium]|nr:hypothetical protein [Rhodospirillales bacterium]